MRFSVGTLNAWAMPEPWSKTARAGSNSNTIAAANAGAEVLSLLKTSSANFGARWSDMR